MKRILTVTIVFICLLLFASCASDGTEEAHNTHNNTLTPQTELTQMQATQTPEPPSQYTTHTIEELGATIVAAGTFWEDWWRMIGPFAWENFEHFDWCGNPLPEHYVTFSPEHTAWLERQEALHQENMARIPAHLHERGAMEILLPSSGFTNMDDILNYLSNYYSDAWLAQHLIDRDEEIPFVGFPFEYYEGRLFVDVNRAGFSRPNWNVASHTLIEQEGNRAVVDTRILWGSWHRVCCGLLAPGHGNISDTLYRFTLIDGRIDSVENPYDIFETYIGRTLPWAMEELESAIVGATTFWEGWWNRAGTFGGSFDSAHWGGWGTGLDVFIEGITDIGYIELLPSSNFASMEDIRNHLAIYFTGQWIEQVLSSYERPPFIVYDNVLYAHVGRWDFDYIHIPAWRTPTREPDWETATFVLMEQDDKHHAVVEMTVERLDWNGETDEVRVRFIFVDGRIDDVIVQ